MGAAPRNRSGGASGVLGTVRVTGQALGAALVAIVLGASAAARIDPRAAHALLGPAHQALWLAASIALVGTAVSATRLKRAKGEV
jgi:DHA2 family multidrug resistance protein-like MFS transporter